MTKEVKDLCEKETSVTYFHNHHVRTGIQANIWNEVWGDDDEPQDNMEMLTDACSYDPDLEKLMKAVDDTCDEFIEGAIDVDTWHKRLTDMERKLSQISYDWKINVPSKGDAYNTMLGTHAFELLQQREVLS